MSLLLSTTERGAEAQTVSGTDSNQSPQPPKPDGFPVPLHVLAAYMRDGTWLDIRTEDGPVHRVRIIGIVVRVRGDDVRFRQEWLEHLDDERKEVKRCSHVLDIDSEAIWKIEPTHYHVDEVEPYGLKIELPPMPLQTDEMQKEVLVTVLRATVTTFNVSMNELRSVRDWESIDARYTGMLVVFEMTNLSATQIAEAFGYKSQTPLLSACHDLKHNRRKGLRDSMKRIARVVESQITFKARRQYLPGNYSPVLPR